MIENCPFCGLNLKKDCNCQERKMRSNMIDSSIFLEVYGESKHTEQCKLLLEGAKKSVYLGNVSTIILGEITKKLLKFKKEADYRYNSIYNNIMDYLLYFNIFYICEDTIQTHKILDIRGSEQSHDKLNFACAIHNKCQMFIMKDLGFRYNKKSTTQIIQITDKNNKKLKKLLEEIKSG